MSITTLRTSPVFPNGDPRRTPEAIAQRRELRVCERDEFGRILPGSVLERAGRPHGVAVTTLARTFTAKAINLLGKVMDDEKAPQAARVTAAQALLDRGWGKAPVQIDLNARTNFADFLRDMGIAARYEHDHPDAAETVE
jgi:hypothetical protein